MGPCGEPRAVAVFPGVMPAGDSSAIMARAWTLRFYVAGDYLTAAIATMRGKRALVDGCVRPAMGGWRGTTMLGWLGRRGIRMDSLGILLCRSAKACPTVKGRFPARVLVVRMPMVPIRRRFAPMLRPVSSWYACSIQCRDTTVQHRRGTGREATGKRLPGAEDGRLAVRIRCSAGESPCVSGCFTSL